MAIEDVAKSLTALCREGKYIEAIEKHYHPDIVSVEAMGDEQMPRVMEGVEAIKGKSQWWIDNHEVHASEIQGPYYNGDQFCVHATSEVTFKPTGKKMTMNEVCLYDVKDDKIVKEHFYYDVTAMGA